MGIRNRQRDFLLNYVGGVQPWKKDHEIYSISISLANFEDCKFHLNDEIPRTKLNLERM